MSSDAVGAGHRDPSASGAGAEATAARPEADATLEDYLRHAALNNPGLKASFNRWKAELERVPQVTSFPDPRFTYRYYIQEVETRVGPQRHAVGISQTFPWFGKLKLRGDVAAKAADAAKARYESEKLKLFHEVKDAYYECYYVNRATALTRQNRDLMRHFESVARAKFRVAAAEHVDVMRAQLELGKLEDRLQSLEELRGPTAARLNAALNRPLDTEVPLPKGIPEESIVATDEDLIGLLGKRNPELAALDHEIEKHRRAGALARKDRAPDVSVGLDYIETGSARMAGVSDSGKDPLIIGVSVNLPIWAEKYKAAEREARRRQWAAIHAKAEKTTRLGYRAKHVLYELRDAERKISLFRDTLVPVAIESLKATEGAYQVGKTSFLDLIDAERVMLEFELSYERALTDHAQRLAELEMLVGQELPRAEAPEPEKAETVGEESSEKPFEKESDAEKREREETDKGKSVEGTTDGKGKGGEP